MTKKRIPAFAREESGAAFIEAAFVIPLALALMVGVTDFGRAFSTLATAEKSIGAAVRYLTFLPGSGVCTGTTPWGITKAKNIALYGNTAGTGSLTVKGWQADNITVTVTPACPMQLGAVIRINADVPFTPIGWTIFGLSSTMTLKAKYEGKWIGT